ncbi:MAG: AraC family transcriptional regulator [Propionibacteriaceae bacterium]
MSLADVARADALPDVVGLLEHCTVEDFVADFVSWGFYDSRSAWRNYWHVHSFYEVCLAFSGHGRFRIGRQDLRVGVGDVFLARPGEVHEIESDATDPLGIAFWGFTLRGDHELSERGWWSGLGQGPAVSTRLGRLPTVLGALSDEARLPRAGAGAVSTALGAALVVETARAFATEDDLAVPRPPRDRASQVVAAMHRHLRDNLSRPLSVRDVAAVVHLSERHAERLFASQTGESLMVTLRQLRLDLAGQLLLDTTRSTVEVARSCGYTDLSAFRLAFRRHHGQSPQAYRASGGTLQLTPMGVSG